MDPEVVTVRHASLKQGDIEAVHAFEDLVAEGWRKWADLNGIIVEGSIQELRKTLLHLLQRNAESLITTEAIAKIHGEASAAEARALVNELCRKMSEFLRFNLVCISGISLRGRSREFSSRDRQISEMRRNGFSYGEIGRKLRINRNAVQAAYRREQRRCHFVYETYPRFKHALAMAGINLREER